jgi:hypothetical protein
MGVLCHAVSEWQVKKAMGFKTALVKNPHHRYYVLLVEQDKIEQFLAYLQQEESEIVEWLDERS